MEHTRVADHSAFHHFPSSFSSVSSHPVFLGKADSASREGLPGFSNTKIKEFSEYSRITCIEEENT